MRIVHYNDSELNGKHHVPVQSTKAYIYKAKHQTEWLTHKPRAFNAISELMNSELQLIIMTLTNSDNEV